MNRTNLCLAPDAVKAFLSGQMMPSELANVEQHLSECEGCRHQLEWAVGPAEWWIEVRESLASKQGLPPSGAELEPTAARSEPLLRILAPSDDPRMLGRLGPYEIVGLIGRGGMGVVLKGFDSALNRYVAIKVLSPQLANSGVARKRFAREAQAVAAVVDDHVMPIHCVSDWQGMPYLVMPYSRGVSLQKRLEREGPLDLREILRIAMQAAKGLAAAHAQGIVHRDVKPGNILLDDGVERVALVDFGLARAVDDASLTHSGTLAGTPQYMSPEQARAESIDVRSDLFSLGSVLYAMCTGVAPFRAETSYAVLRKITDAEPREIREINPEIPPWLCGFVGKLMAKEPQERFPSARQVSELLETCLAHVQRPTEVDLPAELVQPMPAPKRSRFRPRLGVFVVSAAFVTALLATFLLKVTEPPDISGQWSGEHWNRITLEPVEDAPGWYEGSYLTADKARGKLRLSWSRLQQRFNGRWREKADHFGSITLRSRQDDEVQGAISIDGDVKLAADVPRLRELNWEQVTSDAAPDPQASGSAQTPLVKTYDVSDIPLAQRDELLSLIRRLALFRGGTTSISNMEDRWVVVTNDAGHRRIQDKLNAWRKGDRSTPPNTPNLLPPKRSDFDESATSTAEDASTAGLDSNIMKSSSEGEAKMNKDISASKLDAAEDEVSETQRGNPRAAAQFRARLDSPGIASTSSVPDAAMRIGTLFGPAGRLRGRIHDARRMIRGKLSELAELKAKAGKLRLAIDEAKDQARKEELRRELADVEDAIRSYNESRPLSDKGKLNAARMEMEEALREHRTINEILEAAFHAARRIEDTKEAALKRQKNLLEHGTADFSEVTEASEAAIEASSEVEQLRILLNAYQDMTQTGDGNLELATYRLAEDRERFGTPAIEKALDEINALRRTSAWYNPFASEFYILAGEYDYKRSRSILETLEKGEVEAPKDAEDNSSHKDRVPTPSGNAKD